TEKRESRAIAEPPGRSTSGLKPLGGHLMVARRDYMRHLWRIAKMCLRPRISPRITTNAPRYIASVDPSPPSGERPNHRSIKSIPTSFATDVELRRSKRDS